MYYADREAPQPRTQAARITNQQSAVVGNLAHDLRWNHAHGRGEFRAGQSELESQPSGTLLEGALATFKYFADLLADLRILQAASLVGDFG